MYDIIHPKNDGTFPKVPRNRLIHLSLGNGTQWRVGLFDTRSDKCLVVIERMGAFEFHLHALGWLSADYVSEKLNILGGDAINVADFLNQQFDSPNEEKQGRYYKMFCDEAYQEWVKKEKEELADIEIVWDGEAKAFNVVENIIKKEN